MSEKMDWRDTLKQIIEQDAIDTEIENLIDAGKFVAFEDEERIY